MACCWPVAGLPMLASTCWRGLCGGVVLWAVECHGWLSDPCSDRGSNAWWSVLLSCLMLTSRLQEGGRCTWRLGWKVARLPDTCHVHVRVVFWDRAVWWAEGPS